ncbi:MAG: hypothetical protein ACFFEJ_18840 [Candidatus Thorarchaeota archaeon]
MKRSLPILLVALFLAGILIVPVGVTETSARLQETSLDNGTLEQTSEPAWLHADRIVRVALYNETNSTCPQYTIGDMNTNYTFIFDVFANAGYQVTRLTFQDILDHELNTRNYDVFVLADNCPRENISDLVREFWLGGGGILSFDSAAGYLGYAGILPREDLGVDDGLFTYWDYVTNDNGNISARHPVTKAHQIGDQLSYYFNDWAQYDWSALMTTSIAADLTKLTIDDEDSNWAQAIAMDPTDMGGRVVQIGIPIDPWASDWENLMIDSVEWLCPRPKGRILFDLTHQPYYGVDSWDIELCNFANKYVDWRNALVNRSYTFDKLWPSASGNLTAENLQGYDMLIALCPGLNYTTPEVQVVRDWVSAGGGLLAFGEQTSLSEHQANMNYLLNGVGLAVNKTNNIIGTLSTFAAHASTESVTSLVYAAAGVVDTSGAAFPIVTSDNGDVFAGALDYNEGRIILINDINAFDPTHFHQVSNQKFAVAVANWLTSALAEVVVYHDGPNPYRLGIANALNDLGIKFQLHADANYLKYSLHNESWTLVISDANDYAAGQCHTEIIDHLEAGGKLIMRDFMFRLPGYDLWAYLGFTGTNNRITIAPPTVYLWDAGHPIFNNPFDYGANNISSSHNYLNTDFTNVTLLNNATGIAGVSMTPGVNHSAIVLSVGGQAISNMFAVSEYDEDTDDSTYADNYEIWLNEIAYLMRPDIDAPTDITMEQGDTGVTLMWTPQSDRPDSYIIERNSIEIVNLPWDGGTISVLLDGYLLGDYTFEVTIYDTAGMSSSDVVTVTVEDTTAPDLQDMPDNLEYQEGIEIHLLNWSFTDLNPDAWVLFINGTVQDSGSWDGSLISADAGGLTEGIYNATIAVNDTSENTATSMVILTVTAPPTTTTTTTTTTATDTTTTTGTTTPPVVGDLTIIIIIVAAAAAVVVIIIVIMMRKKT